MLRIVMLHVIILRAIMLGVIMLRVIMLRASMLRVIMLSVIVLNAVMLNVAVPVLHHTVCPIASCHLGLFIRQFKKSLNNLLLGNFRGVGLL